MPGSRAARCTEGCGGAWRAPLHFHRTPDRDGTCMDVAGGRRDHRRTEGTRELCLSGRFALPVRPSRDVHVHVGFSRVHKQRSDKTRWTEHDGMGGGSQEIEGMNAAGWPMDELVVGGQLTSNGKVRNGLFAAKKFSITDSVPLVASIARFT
jgi:hypothetical protein